MKYYNTEMQLRRMKKSYNNFLAAGIGLIPNNLKLNFVFKYMKLSLSFLPNSTL